MLGPGDPRRRGGDVEDLDRDGLLRRRRGLTLLRLLGLTLRLLGYPRAGGGDFERLAERVCDGDRRRLRAGGLLLSLPLWRLS